MEPTSTSTDRPGGRAPARVPDDVRLEPSAFRVRVALIAACLAAIALGHAITPRTTHPDHIVHVALRAAYLLPVLLGAVWFEWRGALAVCAGATALFLAHIGSAWGGATWERPNQLAMIGVYWLTGMTAGVLVTLERRAQRRRSEVEHRARREILIRGLAALRSALASRDHDTADHGDAVAELTRAIASELGLEAERVELATLAGRIHDLGKIGVRDDILFKPDRLSPEERERMHAHPAIAAEILAAVPGTEEIARIVAAHHEYLDGSGYPVGLRGGEIPLEAQIVTAADVFCALTDDRPYHQARSEADALEQLRAWSDTKVDGSVVEALARCVRASRAGNSP